MKEELSKTTAVFQSLSHVPEKAMVPHSSTLAWKIPWVEEPGRLQSMGLLRVGHDWVTSLSLFTFMHWRVKWQPTPVFLPAESQGQGSLVGCCLWGFTESETNEVTQQQQQQQAMSNSLLPHGLQHARLPCPSPSPGVYSNSRPLSQRRYMWQNGYKAQTLLPYNQHSVSYSTNLSHQLTIKL